MLNYMVLFSAGIDVDHRGQVTYVVDVCMAAEMVELIIRG